MTTNPAEETVTDPLAEALDDVTELLTRFVLFSHDYQVVMVTLFAAATYTVEEQMLVPYLHVTSPEPDSGKSTLDKLLRRLSYRGVMVGGGGTAAYMGRRGHEVTLIVDEMDNLWKVSDRSEDKAKLAQVLNCGFDREAAHTGKVQGTNPKNMEPVEIPCFGFKIISGIGDLPRVVDTRCLKVALRRAKEGELPERYRPTRTQIEEVSGVAARLHAAVGAHDVDWGDADPDLTGRPDGFINRVEDLWRPLLLIADVAGGDWPSAARDAVAGFLGSRDPNMGLTAIMRDVSIVLHDGIPLETFTAEDGDCVKSQDLVDRLVGLDGSVWAREPMLNKWKLAKLLKPYNVEPGKKKEGRGYLLAELKDLAERYAPLYPSDENATPATLQWGQGFSPISKRHLDPGGGVLKTPKKSIGTGEVAGVAFSDQGYRGEGEEDPEKPEPMEADEFKSVFGPLVSCPHCATPIPGDAAVCYECRTRLDQPLTDVDDDDDREQKKDDHGWEGAPF